jgi:hypothetical protein
MSSSFYQQIETILDADWDYYFGGPKNIPPAKPFVTENTAKLFIEEYFRKGGKEKITEAFPLDDLSVDRADHTVAVFFFGALLLKNTAIGKYKFFDPKVERWYDFTLFMWFVTCLAHDVAYTMEEERHLFAKAISVETLYQELGITHRLLDAKVTGVPKAFWNCIQPYFTYRNGEGRTDHGIYAGVKGFDALVKNRIEKKREVVDDSRYWEPDLDPFYAIAAATIATHNIWLPENSAKIQKYRQAGLEQLIGRGPIMFQEGPLLYFLGLIDTIDPVKAYGKAGIPVLEVLQNVHMVYTSTSCTLTVTGRLDPRDLHRQAEKASEWLEIDYAEQEGGVAIHFKLD